jgi:hypothetical protein
VIEQFPDPVFAAIEHHRLIDAAYDASIERDAVDTLKSVQQRQELAALRALLRTEPRSLAGCLAMLRYVADYAANNRAGLFHDWEDATAQAGKALLPMIADRIEALTRK